MALFELSVPWDTGVIVIELETKWGRLSLIKETHIHVESQSVIYCLKNKDQLP